MKKNTGAALRFFPAAVRRIRSFAMTYFRHQRQVPEGGTIWKEKSHMSLFMI